MCEFCEHGKEIKFYRQETDTNVSECFILGESDGYALFLRQNPKVDITDKIKTKVRKDTKYAHIDMNYCFVCGRKLTEELNEETC